MSVMSVQAARDRVCERSVKSSYSRGVTSCYSRLFPLFLRCGIPSVFPLGFRRLVRVNVSYSLQVREKHTLLRNMACTRAIHGQSPLSHPIVVYFSRERAEDPGTRFPSTVTGMRNRRRQRGPHPWVSPNLSPEHLRCAPSSLAGDVHVDGHERRC